MNTGKTKQQKTILIVDDEDNIKRLLRTTLSSEYKVVEASDGESAVRMALRHKPDLIMMDIIMPGVNGYAACKLIKSSPVTSSIPVVMLTAVDFNLKAELSQQTGAEAYIIKPFSQEQLLAVVERILNARRNYEK